MIKLKIIISFLFCFALLTNAQERVDKRFHMRFAMGPVIEKFYNNKNHTASTRQKASFFFAIRPEIRIGRRRQVALMPGFEYLYHGLTFNSYYFKEGYDFLYDKEFKYKYTVTASELLLPLLVKLAPQKESKKHVTPFGTAGYVFRYMMPANLQITSIEINNDLVTKSTALKLEHPFYASNIASYLHLGGGFQRNILQTHKAFVFELNLRISLQRFGIKETYTPSSLFIRNHWLNLSVGYKF